MATSMKLDILTPVGAIHEDVTVPGVEVPGLLGELGILAEHESFITAIVPGVVRFRNGAESVRLAIGTGFVEVKDGGRVVILCERALTAAEVDTDSVKSRLSEVQGELSGYDGTTAAAEYRNLKTEHAWLTAQLAV